MVRSKTQHKVEHFEEKLKEELIVEVPPKDSSTHIDVKIDPDYEETSGKIHQNTQREIKMHDNICRVCLKEGYIPIFGIKDWSKDLKTFAAIEVRNKDPHPKHLCVSCSSHLEDAVLFRRTAQESDYTLKHQRLRLSTHNDAASNNGTNNKDIDAYRLTRVSDNDENDTKDKYIVSNISPSASTNDAEDQDVDTHSNFPIATENDANEQGIGANSPPLDSDSDHYIKDYFTLEDLSCCSKINKKNKNIQGKGKEFKKESALEKSGLGQSLHCGMCNLNFESNEEYNNHRLTVEHDSKKVTCPVCNNIYTSKYLKWHLLLHKTDTEYPCDLCEKKFKVPRQLQRHRKTHFVNDLPYKCPMCPYKGRVRANLRLHMRQHTGEKPYQCPQCPARFFTNASNLKKHLLQHKTEYDFECDECNRGFFRKQDIESHLKAEHMGIKEHVCNICGRAYGYRHQLLEHERNVHKRAHMRKGMSTILVLESEKQQTGKRKRRT